MTFDQTSESAKLNKSQIIELNMHPNLFTLVKKSPELKFHSTSIVFISKLSATSF